MYLPHFLETIEVNVFTLPNLLHSTEDPLFSRLIVVHERGQGRVEGRQLVRCLSTTAMSIAQRQKQEEEEDMEGAWYHRDGLIRLNSGDHSERKQK